MPPRISLEYIKNQLVGCEHDIDVDAKMFVSDFYSKWRRHYLLKRLLELQLKEYFSCE